jgi:G3E family GTPase
MAELILISGFLGAGKTTLLKRLILEGMWGKLRVIVNEFGRAAVDGALIKALGAVVEEITDGSIFCACRVSEFVEALNSAVRDGADMILVEASGFSDPVSIHTIISGIPGIRYRGCLCVADAISLPKVAVTSRVCRRQLGISGLILLNKTDIATPAQLQSARQLLSSLCPFTPVRETAYANFPLEWLEELKPRSGEIVQPHARDMTLQKAFIRISPEMDSRSLLFFIRLFAENTLRVKGIVQLKDGLYIADCVGPIVEVSLYRGQSEDAAGGLTALAGEGMPLRESLEYAAGMYRPHILEIC